MRQEYTYTLRMLMVLLLHQGDFVRLRQLLDAFKTDRSFDQVAFAKMWQGEKLFDQAKEKGVIMRCGEGFYGCGIAKTEIFRTCVVPALKTFYQQQGEMRRVLAEFVDRLNQNEDVEMK